MLYNETKNRKATANETAKAILIDAIQSRMEFLDESFYLDDVKKFDGVDEKGWGKPTKEYEEICRHFEKHFNSIIDKLLNSDTIIHKR
tara:strand:+ start:293 stop:556 length:264 start_codon:yes stop_codon:yes gene_type:complete